MYSSWLRYDYVQTVARWVAKFVRPNTVHIGDSITAGGQTFNNWRDLNFGSNGLHAYQIAGDIPKALAYSPRHIVVMAGTNDAGAGAIDAARERSVWRTICREPKIIVTLAPPTAFDELNAGIARVNEIAREECKDRPVIDLAPALAGKDGRIQPHYTADGVHPTPEAYGFWRAALRKHGA